MEENKKDVDKIKGIVGISLFAIIFLFNTFFNKNTKEYNEYDKNLRKKL